MCSAVFTAAVCLSCAAAYTSLALFNLLRLPLAFLPMMVTMLINALVALNRIGDFLTKSESGLAALRTAAEGMPAGHIKVGAASSSLSSSTIQSLIATCASVAQLVCLGGFSESSWSKPLFLIVFD
jgi:hypothetical protein